MYQGKHKKMLYKIIWLYGRQIVTVDKEINIYYCYLMSSNESNVIFIRDERKEEKASPLKKIV